MGIESLSSRDPRNRTPILVSLILGLILAFVVTILILIVKQPPKIDMLCGMIKTSTAYGTEPSNDSTVIVLSDGRKQKFENLSPIPLDTGRVYTLVYYTSTTLGSRGERDIIAAFPIGCTTSGLSSQESMKPATIVASAASKTAPAKPAIKASVVAAVDTKKVPVKPATKVAVAAIPPAKQPTNNKSAVMTPSKPTLITIRPKAKKPPPKARRTKPVRREPVITKRP